MKAHRLRNDDGATLIIAIVIVTVVALVIGVILTRGDGSLRATVALREVAGSRTPPTAPPRSPSTTSGPATTLAPASRRHPGTTRTRWARVASGTTAQPADNAEGHIGLESDPEQSSDTQSAMSAAVLCTPEDATGARAPQCPSTVEQAGQCRPHAGSSGSETGFRFKTNGAGAAFRVSGGIWSNSDIVRDNNGNLEATEYIRANNGCTPSSAMVAPIVNCNASTAPDPNYPSDLDVAGTGIPALQTPPASCPGTVTLSPGYYDDVTKLNALTDTNSDCTIHLQPGTYYFDFHNNVRRDDPLFDPDIASNTGNVWTIGSGKTLIAGPSPATRPCRAVRQPDRRRQRERGAAHLRWRQPDESWPAVQAWRSAAATTPTVRRSRSTGRRRG